MPIEISAFRSPWANWSAVTWFGDSNLLLPAAAVLALALVLGPTTRRLVPRWLLAFGLTGFVVLAAKIAFAAWGIGNADLDFTGFSGHSALSACFWPVWAWLLTARLKNHSLDRIVIAAGYLFAVAIAYSRLVLDAHSVSEVVSGLLIGAGASAWFLAGARRRATPRATVPALPPVPAIAAIPAIPALVLTLLSTIVLTVTLHGRPAPTTHWIEKTTMRLLGITTPFTRHDLRMRLRRL